LSTYPARFSERFRKGNSANFALTEFREVCGALFEGKAGKKHLVSRTDARRQALSEQNTEQAISVRQITDVHANWSSQGPLEQGKFSYQLILDNGVEEALIMPTADDAKVLRDLIHDADTLYWDMDNEVIIFGKVD
jgi:hypothetical protein